MTHFCLYSSKGVFFYVEVNGVLFDSDMAGRKYDTLTMPDDFCRENLHKPIMKVFVSKMGFKSPNLELV